MTDINNADATNQSSNEMNISVAQFNIKDAGAKGDGITDDTEAIQNTLKKYDNVYIPDGTYLINADKSLRPKSNQTISMADGAILKALPSERDVYSIILINAVMNVTITGGQIIGDRDNHVGTTGELGCGVKISDGASNITVRNLKSSKCWGDGFYIGGYGTARVVNNIFLDNVAADYNRRQGLSITNATQVTVSNSIFMNTVGSGIVIEPNVGKIVQDITLNNVQCHHNGWYGLSLVGIKEKIADIKIDGSNFSNNSKNGIYITELANLECSNTICSNNRFGIEIINNTSSVSFRNITLSTNQYYGIGIKGMNLLNIGIDNIAFSNATFCNNSQVKANAFDGVRISTDSGYIKDISFTGCNFYDDQTTKTQRYGMTAGPTGNISNIVIDKTCSFNGNGYPAIIG